MQSTYALEGLCTLDATLGHDTVVELCPDGVHFRHPGGQRAFIRTGRRPEPGLKLDALDPLTPVLEGPMITRKEAGGGAARAAAALAGLFRDAPARGDVLLLNSGSFSPELDDLCGRAGIRCHSVGRQDSPCNLIIPLRNRLILRGPNQPCPTGLDDGQRQEVGRGLARAGALASVSARDGPLATAAAALCNGARRYFQPTGSLAPELTLLFLSVAHEVVCNLAEWSRIGQWAGVSIPDVGEDSPEAPEAAVQLLRSLRGRHWAGSEAAACTLGRHGAVILDPVRDRAYHVTLEMTDGSPGVATPAGTGDTFLAAWIYYRETWSRQDHLRDPLAVTAVRATHVVANTLGLRRDRYDVRFIRQ